MGLIFLDEETIVEEDRIDAVTLNYVDKEYSDKDEYEVFCEFLVGGEVYNIPIEQVAIAKELSCLHSMVNSLKVSNLDKITEHMKQNDEREIE
jgi:hypothetical protein